VRYLSLAEVLELHRRITATAGGAALRDLGALEAAVAQPRASFAGDDLYPDLPSKATALAFSLINNHPFVDGNKRIGHAALETVLMLNGYELDATVDEGERIILAVASGQAGRDELLTWVRAHLTARTL
jgi:death-on-curing protein